MADAWVRVAELQKENDAMVARLRVLQAKLDAVTAMASTGAAIVSPHFDRSYSAGLSAGYRDAYRNICDVLERS